MVYRIMCVGKMKDSFYRNEIDRWQEKVRKLGQQLEIVEFPDLRIPDNLKEENKEAFLEKECSRMRDKITNRDYVIALCIEGKELITKKHAAHIRKAKEWECDSVTYVIGGSLGLPKWVKQRANLCMSFSKMTFPHQMMRMVLCEEITNAIQEERMLKG